MNKIEEVYGAFFSDALAKECLETPLRLVVPVACARMVGIGRTDLMELLANFMGSLRKQERVIHVKYSGGEFDCTLGELSEAIRAIENGQG